MQTSSFGSRFCCGAKLLVIACSVCSGDIHYVSINGADIPPYTDWASAATSVQKALGVSQSSDTVIISNGVYVISSTLMMTNAIVVRSISGPRFTTLDGSNAMRVAYIGHAQAMLEGLTITRGFVSSTDPLGGTIGGGVHCANGSVVQCVIVSNRTIQGGGGLYLGGGAALRDSLVYDNSSDRGGGVFSDGGAILNSTIAHNSAPGNGGGVRWRTGTTRIINSIVYFNTPNNFIGEGVGTLESMFSCSPTVLSGQGNISNDPAFVSFTPRDYHIQVESLCRDTGTNWLTDSNDLDGAPRIMNGHVDMGAFEVPWAFLDVTSAQACVTYETDAFRVAGTNGPDVAGQMWVSSSANGDVHSFAATPFWETPQVALLVGTNSIVVYGTNAVGTVASDMIEAIRMGIGSGAPFVDITNDPPAQLNYHISSFILGGTNNIHVQGGMWWSNTASSAIGDVARTDDAWMAAVAGLVEGTNVIHVFGTNLWNQIAADTIMVCRGFEKDLPLIEPLTAQSVREHQVLFVELIARENVAEIAFDASAVQAATHLDSNSWLFTIVPEFSTAGKRWEIPFVAANAFGSETQTLTVTVLAPSKHIDAKHPGRYEDEDGDIVDIKYSGVKKAGSTVLFDGQNLSIINGYAKGKLAVKVKQGKTGGDGVFELCSLTKECIL